MLKTVKEIAKKSEFIRKNFLKMHIFGQTVRGAGWNWELIRLIQRVRPFSMVSPEGLRAAYELVGEVEEKKIPGAVVECGVWKGGCSGVMAYVIKRAGSGRPQWLFDSFEGLPEPDQRDGAKADEYSSGRMSGRKESIGILVASENDAKEVLFNRIGAEEKNVHIRKGWFQDTLPRDRKEIGPIALLRLDGDWYESTKVCLDNLYDQVVPGGYILIDDYGYWEGCAKAVDEFLKNRNIKAKLHFIDKEACYLKKEDK